MLDSLVFICEIETEKVEKGKLVVNILLTSVGRRSYLVKYFKDAVGESGKVYVSNSTEISPAFVVADDSVVTPLIYSEDYIPFLLKYCSENHIDILIPLFDVDLPVLSKHKEKFRELGTDVIVSSEEFLEICNDKWKTYLYLSKKGFHVPATFLSVDEAIAKVNSNELSYPLIVKPRWGMGSIAVYVADNEEELRVFYNKIKREIFNSYLKYESVNNEDECVLVQEKLAGQEYGLDIINDLHGEFQVTICKKKYAMRSGETDCALTVNEECLKSIGEKLGRHTRHIANLDCDVFLCEGIPYVLEMNARFGGGYPFSHMAGVNLPKAIVEWHKGETDCGKYLREKNGVLSHKDINIVLLDN